MKILFFIPSLRAGGAERVASVLCNHWSESEHKVVVVTYDDPQQDFYKLNNHIRRVIIGDPELSGNIFNKIRCILRRISNLRCAVKREKPDVVVSFMHMPNVIALLACLWTKIPVVISERTYPQYYNNNNLFDIMRKQVYKLTSCLVAQTHRVAQWGANFLAPDKIVVIANPLNVETITQNHVTRDKNVVAVGRLTHEKGFDMLIEAYAKLQPKFADWPLLIVGDGPERANLDRQIKQLKLEQSIILVGQSANPQQYYASAGIFVLSSRVEGFPNVLLEAMANGAPVISFDCNSGPADMIKDGVSGLLVTQDDVAQLARSMQNLIENEELRTKLAANALQVRDTYKLENISAKWLQLFNSLALHRLNSE